MLCQVRHSTIWLQYMAPCWLCWFHKPILVSYLVPPYPRHCLTSNARGGSTFYTPNVDHYAAARAPKADASNDIIWISSDEELGEQDDHANDHGQNDDECGHQEMGQDEDDDSEQSSKDKSTLSTPVASHWTFYDYFDDDLKEKPLLLDMRKTVANTRRMWRDACKKADHAKINLKYAATSEDTITLKKVYEDQCDIRDKCAKVKRQRELNVKKHENIAKDRLRTRKKQDKEAAAAARKTQHRRPPAIPQLDVAETPEGML